MIDPRERESRPRHEAAIPGLTPSVAPSTDVGTDDTTTVAALKGYGVIVLVPGAAEPRGRRRLFLSLHSAQRAVERAAARGLDAHLVLVRLVPEAVVV